EAALAADPDDLVRVHLRRPAAGDGPRRRCGDAAFAGGGGLLRHAGRDALWHLPDAGFLPRVAVVRRKARAAGRGAARRQPAGGFPTGGLIPRRSPPSYVVRLFLSAVYLAAFHNMRVSEERGSTNRG